MKYAMVQDHTSIVNKSFIISQTYLRNVQIKIYLFDLFIL